MPVSAPGVPAAPTGRAEAANPSRVSARTRAAVRACRSSPASASSAAYRCSTWAIRCCANAVHRVVPGRLRQEAQRVGGEVVVVGLESLVACFAHDVGPGRATPAAVAADGLTAADEAELDEVLEVPADGRGGQAKLVGERGCGDGAALADRLKDAVARARLQGVRRGRDVLALVFGDKHNTHVT